MPVARSNYATCTSLLGARPFSVLDKIRTRPRNEVFVPRRNFEGPAAVPPRKPLDRPVYKELE